MNDSTAVTTSVYRYYDKHRILIYVGITGRGITRNSEHDRDKDWWPYVVRQEVDHLPSRPAALLREIELIQQYRPPFNTQHHPGAADMLAAYLAFIASGIGDRSAIEIYQETGGTIPLVLHSDHPGVGSAVLRTGIEHAGLVLALDPTRNRVKLRLQRGLKVGHVEAFLTRGPYAAIQVRAREGVDLSTAQLDVRPAPRKGPITYEARRIMLPEAAFTPSVRRASEFQQTTGKGVS